MSNVCVEWRPVVGWEDEGYEVSNKGQVRSYKRRGTKIRRKDPVLLNPWPNHKGHLLVHLSRTGFDSIAFVHTLVLEAFDKPRPPGLQGLHGDDNKDNNSICNLRWGTAKENFDDQIINSIRASHGIKHFSSRIKNEDDIHAIRSDARPNSVIAKQYGITAGTVGKIKRLQTYTDIPICDTARPSQHGMRNNLTPESIREIKLSDKSYKTIALEFNTSFSTVGRIKRGELYSDIYPDVEPVIANKQSTRLLSDEQVELIKHSALTCKDLGKLLNVSKSLISSVRRGGHYLKSDIS